MATIDQRVARGAQLLDREGPTGWREQIECDTLDLSDCKQCILGQLYGDYEPGLYKLRVYDGTPQGFERANTDTPTPIASAKRQYARLTAAWRRELDC